MEGNTISVGFLNVVATPHPEGAYVDGLNQISNKPVRYRGKDYGVILDPQPARDEPGIVEGRISIWTDIDSSEPSIDKSTFEQKNVEDSLREVFAREGSITEPSISLLTLKRILSQLKY